MTLLEWVTSTYLLNAAWLAILVVLAAGAAELLLRRVPARFLHRIWIVAAAVVVLAPLWSLRPEDTPAPPPATSIVLPELPPLIPLPAPPPATRGSLPLGRYPLLGLLATCGAAVLWRLLALLAGLRRVRLLRAAAHTDAPEAAWLAARRHEQQFGLDCVDVRTAPGLLGPVAIGARQPLIVLAEGFTQACTGDELAAVLGHEMAHIARHDYAANLALEILLLPVAWHPAAWMLRRRLMQTREMACDELAASCLLTAPRYARSLLAVAVSTAEVAPALGISDGDNLKERLSHLLTPLHVPSPWRLAACAGLLVLAGATASAFVLEAGKVLFRPTPASVTGLWRGEDRLSSYALVLTARDGRLSGTLTLARPLVAAHAFQSIPPPPPPRGVRLTGGPLHSASIEGGAVRFQAGTSNYVLRFAGRRTATLLHAGPGKRAWSTAVSLTRAD